jgi:hypothetical protein
MRRYLSLVRNTLCILFSDGLRLSPLGSSATLWPVVPAPHDRWLGWLWSNRWNTNWQGKPKYSEKTCHSSTLSSQIAHDLIRVWTRAAAVGSRRLIAWAMTRPNILCKFKYYLRIYCWHFFPFTAQSNLLCGSCGCTNVSLSKLLSERLDILHHRCQFSSVIFLLPISYHFQLS